jgi:outer membrane protein assembly factor BamE (lipoprotein component of BamABCDE complex)
MVRPKKTLLSVILALTLVVLLWPFYPVSIKRQVIIVTSISHWSKFQKLRQLLRLGMEQREVELVLGPPDVKEARAIGARWTYCERGSTAGGVFIVEFKPQILHKKQDDLRLCYIANFEHVVFPDAQRFEMGEKLEGGKFAPIPFIPTALDK